MKANNINNRLIDSYLELLSNMSITAKRDLIAKLTKSVAKNGTSKRKTFALAFGAWDTKANAKVLAKAIRTSRHFSRKIADL
jgi:hypothetical protein